VTVFVACRRGCVTSTRIAKHHIASPNGSHAMVGTPHVTHMPCGLVGRVYAGSPGTIHDFQTMHASCGCMSTLNWHPTAPPLRGLAHRYTLMITHMRLQACTIVLCRNCGGNGPCMLTDSQTPLSVRHRHGHLYDRATGPVGFTACFNCLYLYAWTYLSHS
jgi:hypothetical protein